MMTSRILKFMNSLKIQKSEDLESEKFFSANKKNCLLYIQGYNITRNSFLAVVTFN